MHGSIKNLTKGSTIMEIFDNNRLYKRELKRLKILLVISGIIGTVIGVAVTISALQIGISGILHRDIFEKYLLIVFVVTAVASILSFLKPFPSFIFLSCIWAHFLVFDFNRLYSTINTGHPIRQANVIAIIFIAAIEFMFISSVFFARKYTRLKKEIR